MANDRKIPQFCMLLAILALTIPSCAGLSDLPNLFATPTPTATSTFTPSPTPTITPSPTPTLTPTPLPTGIQIDAQEDGSIVFLDYDNKYQLVLSRDWLVIPFKKADYVDAIEQLADELPQLAAAAEAFQDLDPNVFRLVALNRNADFALNTFATNLNITAFSDEILSAMPLEFVTGALEGSFEQNGATVLTSGVNILENAHEVDVQFIDTERTVNGANILQRIVVFQSNKRLVLISITTLKQFADGVFPAADEIAGSIEYLK